MFWLNILVVIACFTSVTCVKCAENAQCQCIAGYIGCRGVMKLPDVLSSRVYPLVQKPPTVADLSGSALSLKSVKRFLLVYGGSLRKLILKDQIQDVCGFVDQLKQMFPSIEMVTECQVRISVNNMKYAVTNLDLTRVTVSRLASTGRL